MAYYLHSFFLLLCLVMAITQLTFAGRQLPTPAKDPNKKQPEWFIEPDGSVLIPGIGRYMIPSYKSYPTIPTFGGSGSGTPTFGSGSGSGSGSGTPPFGSGSGTPPFGSSSGGDSGSGSGGGSSSGGAGGMPGSYIPGGDDTFVPNPGVEVPNPFGGGVPAPNVP